MKKKLFLFVILISLFVLPLKVMALTDAEIQEKKEVTVNSVPPTKMMEYYQVNELFNKQSGGYNLEDCNDSYTVCTVTKSGSEIATGVTVKYEYDEVIKRVVDGIMENVPEGGISFTLNDIEMLYYLRDLVQFYMGSEYPDPDDEPNPLRYSSAYNAFMGYKNFVFEPRLGYDAMFQIFKEGTAAFKYDGTIYGFSDGISAFVPVILFVDDDETDVRGALEERLQTYFPGAEVLEDTTSSPLDEFQEELDNRRENYRYCKGLREQVIELEEIEANDPSAENQQNRFMAQQNYNHSCPYYDDAYEFDDEDGYMEEFEEDIRENEWRYIDSMVGAYYEIDFADGVQVIVGAAKDSSKVFNDEIKVITSDTSSEVTISASSVIPLDTLIQVARLTSGEDYEKIVNLLKDVVNTNSLEMFDLKLFSKSINDYITTLDDGNFEVKLPLSEELKGKENLIVYFVDEDDNLEVHPVRLSDDGNFAIFTTDHFSIYTLGESEGGEPTFKVTYDFNGGLRQGEGKYITEGVAIGLDIIKASFIDQLGVIAPEGKELDAILVNGTRYELGSNYLLNQDTVFKYLWKNIATDEETDTEATPVSTQTTTTNNPKTGDNIFTYVLMLILSIIGLTCSGLYVKKRFN